VYLTFVHATFLSFGTMNTTNYTTMIHFFENQSKTVFAVQTKHFQLKTFQNKLAFADSHKIEKSVITDFFVGPRSTMVTPWVLMQ
jgi:phosphoribosylformylglycinamidine synthase